MAGKPATAPTAATAAAVLKETFGSDRQPGAYKDIDVTDCIFHVGHNMAATDTVLWMRVLDRRAGPNPPKLIVVDPRLTPTAKEADLHLACQANDVNLLLGRIGWPGCGIPQMNGQPTAQNTRETGADGDPPGFRNWANREHVRELAALWNVEPDMIPHWSPPTHALDIFRHCETGSIRMLWISAANSAVSMPNLPRVRKILEKEDLFVVAQDAFMTETTQLADVVLPAAIWGEKTGCMTNVSRTVHLSHQAIDPPGEARSDFDIFVDYAPRMDFRDKDGALQIKWSDPEGAFNGWRECTRGRPCDYTGLSYAKLTGGSGIPWPVNEQHSRRLGAYLPGPELRDSPGLCGAFRGGPRHRRAVVGGEVPLVRTERSRLLKGTHDCSPAEVPDAQHPFYLTTGRLMYHFHTRTKTGRSRALANAAPDDFVQIPRADAEKLGIGEGDWVRVTSRRGAAEARAMLGDIGPGQVFIPFHFGYRNAPGRARAANELTLYEWDPISKQPYFKYAAVKIERVEAPTTSQPIEVNLHPGQAGGDPSLAASVRATIGRAVKTVAHAALPGQKPRAHLADYLELLHASETRLVKAFAQVRETHPDTPDVVTECRMFDEWARGRRRRWSRLWSAMASERNASPSGWTRRCWCNASRPGSTCCATCTTCSCW